MKVCVGQVTLPGDEFDMSPLKSNKKIVVGPGLAEFEGMIKIIKPGILRYREPATYWIDSHQKRYVANKGDLVVGIVTQKVGDIFRVDIGSSEQASLSYLSFEGATKRNRPDVKIGDIVYANVLVANKDMEPELVCIDSDGHSNGLGVIRSGGFLFQSSLHLVRKLLNPNCVLQKTLGKTFEFETAIGMNGRIWVRAQSDIQTITMANAILASEHMNNVQIETMCKKLCKVASKMD
ncbi:exosome complex component RRP40 [Biomphalaria glabrata]|nr:exosome complex component RRP40 [Biomphalaria glabrata]